MVSTLLLGIFIGFVGCLYYLASKKRKTGGPDHEVKGQTVFLNFLILDKSEAIRAGVETKLSEKIGSGFFRDKLKKSVGRLAASNISDEAVAVKMSSSMVEQIPSKLFEIGLVATASRVYGKGSFFVIKLTIMSADIQKLIDKVAGKEKGSMFDEVMNILGGKWARDSLEEKMIPAICSKIQDKLPMKMKEAFDVKGLQCDITVKSDSEEADFFFSCIEFDSNNAA